MRVLFASNSDVAIPLVEWLQEQGEELIFVNQRLDVAFIETHQPEMLVSYNYRHIVSDAVLSALDGKALNLHISLLPWNKGAQPNVWSFLKNTPKGVTIHVMDKGLDTGNILYQSECTFDESVETFSTTYDQLHMEIQQLFKANWDVMKSWETYGRPQTEAGSIQYAAELNPLSDQFGDRLWDTPIAEIKQQWRTAEGEYEDR